MSTCIDAVHTIYKAFDWFFVDSLIEKPKASCTKQLLQECKGIINPAYFALGNLLQINSMKKYGSLKAPCRAPLLLILSVISCLSVWIVNKCASAIIEFYVCVFPIISYFQSRKWACVWNNVWLLLSLYHCLEFINMIMKCGSVVLSIAHQDLNVNVQPLKEELGSDHVWSRFMPFLPFCP